MVGGGEVGMEVPVVALAARMTCWAVGGRRYHPFVSFFVSVTAVAETFSTIADNCNNVLAFLQAVAVKSP